MRVSAPDDEGSQELLIVSMAAIASGARWKGYEIGRTRLRKELLGHDMILVVCRRAAEIAGFHDLTFPLRPSRRADSSPGRQSGFLEPAHEFGQNDQDYEHDH